MLELSSNLQEGAPGLIMQSPLSCPCCLTADQNTDNFREEDDYSVGRGYLLEGGCCLGFNNKFLKN